MSNESNDNPQNLDERTETALRQLAALNPSFDTVAAFVDGITTYGEENYALYAKEISLLTSDKKANYKLLCCPHCKRVWKYKGKRTWTTCADCRGNVCVWKRDLHYAVDEAWNNYRKNKKMEEYFKQQQG